MRHRAQPAVKNLLYALLGAALAALPSGAASPPPAAPEVRGTWLTTTANDHIASPARTAETMRRLREIGLNSVYVETWKNGYTQYPSRVLEDLIGVDRRPDLAKQDPSDPDKPMPARDLLEETLIEAHRNGLAYIAWFEYGFMAAHKDTDNHLRKIRPDWLSRDIEGNEIAPNGFVWLNPLHPETRRFLLDIVLEAVDLYDLDGVQLDDRIVWPYVTMGYDDYTVAVYRNEHGGAAPPEDHTDPDWIAWRSEKITDYARQFVAELREARPGLIVSVSPAPYPWVYENYCLNWPLWAEEGLWDEYIPQCYRYSFEAFEPTWISQTELMTSGEARVSQLIAGVLTTGSRPDPVPWADLERKIDLVRSTGGGGHVWWFSRGVLDEYPDEITELYGVSELGPARRPDLPRGWRRPSIAMVFEDGRWTTPRVPEARYRVIVHDGEKWSYLPDGVLKTEPVTGNMLRASVDPASVDASLRVEGEARGWRTVELLIDRREDTLRPRRVRR